MTGEAAMGGTRGSDKARGMGARGSDKARRGGARPVKTAWPRGARWFWIVLLAICVLASYRSGLSGVLVLDDHRSIADNARIRDLTDVATVLSGRRPVLDATLAVNYALGGLAVTGYHVVNLLIHLLAALTLFGVIARTLQRPAPAKRFGRAGAYLAGAAALVWAVHPLQTQSVTYVIQRSESLMGLFYLLTLYALLRGAEGDHPWRWYALGVAACALGMGSKAVMVTAPVTVLLFDRCFLSGSLREALKRRWGLYLCLAATWGLLWTTRVAPGVLSTSRAGATVGFSVQGFTSWTYLMTQAGVLTHYLRLAVWPYPLCLDYGWPAARGATSMLAPALIVALPAIVTIGGYARRRAWAFPGVWFFVILGPTSSVVPIRDAAFEHRMYLPLAAVVIAVVIGAYAVIAALTDRVSMGTVTRRVRLGRRTWSVVLVAVSAVSLGAATARRNRVYQSELTVWQDVAEKRPDNARAYDNVGYALEKLGRHGEAIAAFRTAIQKDPNNPNAHCNFGFALTEEGRDEAGLEHYKTALALDPNHANANRNYGVALAKRHRLDEAVAAFERAIKANPLFADAHDNLCAALNEQGRYDDAVAACRRALDIDPSLSDAHFNLGVTLYRLGRFEEAVWEYDRTLELAPGNAAAEKARAVANNRWRAQVANDVRSE